MLILCYLNEFGRKKHGILNYFRGILKELGNLGCRFGSYRKTRYLLKVVFIVCFTHIISLVITGLTHGFDKEKRVTATAIFLVGLSFILIFKCVYMILCGILKFNAGGYATKDNTFVGWFKEKVFRKAADFIEGHNRLYLRINFGHRLKDEKDILRLIARTLLIEYAKYRRSFWKRPIWGIIAFIFLFIFASLLSNPMRNLDIYTSIKECVIKQTESEPRDVDKGDYVAYVENVNVKDVNEPDITNINRNKRIYIKKDFFGVELARKVIIGTDKLVCLVSRQLQGFLGYLWTGKKSVRQDGLDHSFWLSFFLLYLFFITVFRSRWLSSYFVTNRMIVQRLKDLNSDITYSTEREMSTTTENNASVGKYFGMSKRTGTKMKRSRGVADAREIERELQEIFQEVQRIPIFMGRPKFVIVFDELDKVEPDDVVGTDNATPETKATLFSIDAARERQSEILKIMSNMKYFLSTSEAKFIFIAGREMYDIYLADVSDRNNYIGSIFSAVIEVPSFLTDYAEKTNKADMTSLTEEFVCRRLIPSDYRVADDSYNLKTYRKYLENEIYKVWSNDIDDNEITQKIHKIITVLRHFIIYLAHVSKGAPKKMMQLFETLIEVQNIEANKKVKNRLNDLTVQYYRRSKFFLTFDFYQQYAMGLLAYLVTPIFYRLVERNISAHNDKLLVSSLRFVDFVFKFHKYSFMWKHIDISPEMLEINRAPELRPITVDLFNYMVQKHMTKSSFSLFDYKFNSLIAGEIFAATKINEVLSALFSFSLDETLPLKQHYKDLLAKTQKEYQNDKRFSSIDFIDAISSLQIVLGDLHYFDDELEEAGIYYRDAIEALRKLGSRNDDDKLSGGGYRKGAGDRRSNDNNRDHEYDGENETMNPEELYLFVRNMLKVGMIYETRKQHEQAYLIYGEVCRRVIRERDISIKELGAGIAIRRDDSGKIVFVKTSVIGPRDRKNEMYYDNVETPKVEFTAKVYNGIVDDNIASPQPLYFQRISPNTNDMLFRKMTYEGLKLLYLPFIVKLQILEKSHMGGITRTHLEQLDKEFELLTFIIDHKEANILEADFYSRVADVLYYKNSDLKEVFGKNRLFYDASDMRISDKNVPNPQNHSCTACHYYHKALSKLLNKDEKNKNETTVIKLLSDCVKKLNGGYYNVKFCTVLARILSDWGNAFLSCDNTNFMPNKPKCYILDNNECDTQEANIIVTKLKRYINYVCSESNSGNNTSFFTEHNYSKIEIAFVMYTTSFQAFCIANHPNRASYQIYKMLRLFKQYQLYEETDIKDLSQKAISLLWHVADESNALELKKRELDFDKDNKNDNYEVPLRYLLVDNEIAILAVLVKELELARVLNLESVERNYKLKELYNMHVASPHGTIYSISARIFQLRLKADVNYEAYRSLIFKTISIDVEKEDALDKEIDFIIEKKADGELLNKIFGEHDIGDNIFEMLIAESIYCLKAVVRQSKTLGETYLFNHSFLGKIHESLYFWGRRYEIYNKRYKEKYGNTKQLDKLFKSYLGDGWKEQLSAHYELHQALLCYQKCVEVHREGKAYHTLIDSLYYVKDDYNDRSDHFSIAIERHKVLNGEIKERVEKLEKSVTFNKDSKYYNVNNYFETDGGKK